MADEVVVGGNGELVGWLRRFGGSMAKDPVTSQMSRRIFEAAEALELANVGLSREDAAEVGSRRIARLLAPGVRVVLHFVSERKLLVEIIAVGRYEVVARVLTESQRYGQRVIVPKHAVLFYELLEGEG